MKRLILSLTSVFLLLAAMGSVAFAAETHQVDLLIRRGQPVPEFFFEPVGLYINPGDTVTFNGLSPHHTVTAYHPLHGKPQRVPDGVEPFSSPVIPVSHTWSYTFTIPGVYDIWCAPHEQYGMVMRIVVGEATGPATEPSTDFGPEGTFGVAGVILNHPLLAPSRIQELTSVSWFELPDEAKVAPAMPTEH